MSPSPTLPKEYGNSVSFVIDGTEPDERMVSIVRRQLEMDFEANRGITGSDAPFPGVIKGPVVEAHEPCPADLESHWDCPVCEGTGQGDIIPGKFVHSYGWYLVVP